MSLLQELNEDKAEMEMTPMIDVTFLLLIFFMCTLKFKTLEGKLAAYLPKDVGVNQSDAEPIEKVEVLVRVREAGAKLKPTKPPREYTADDTGRFVYTTLDQVSKYPELKRFPVRKLEYSVGPFRTQDLEELRKRLTQIFRERKALDEEKVPATIDARVGTVYDDIVDVLDQAIDAGFTDITFVGAYDDNIK